MVLPLLLAAVPLAIRYGPAIGRVFGGASKVLGRKAATSVAYDEEGEGYAEDTDEDEED